MSFACPAAEIRRALISAHSDEQTCRVPASASTFQPAQREAFLWFTVERIRTGDRIRVDWVAPSGATSETAEYKDLPASAALCFTTRLAIAGFPRADEPGSWQARVYVSDRLAATRSFTILADPEAGRLRITAIARTGAALTISGSGFSSEAMLHIAQYTRTGGWTYVASLQPRRVTATELLTPDVHLAPAEYLAIVQNADGQVSRPAPFVIATASAYKLPTLTGEKWILTQGPYGTFSHWGNSLHAYDIAPRTDRCVVAMRGGIVHTHDLRMHQDHLRRTFGNYISIDHGDGEFSHYAHLQTGTFLVREGQHVEQGQALAMAGNSGYTLGEGGGYHVHVHVTRTPSISSQSVPFNFEDLPRDVRPGTGAVVSTNGSPLCDCRPHGAAASIATATPQFTGTVAVEQWWSDTVVVRPKANVLSVVLNWTGRDADLDLHLVSPDGQHFGWYGATQGYSGQGTNPQQFQIANPAAGVWRISVQGVKGSGAPIAFAVNTSGEKGGVVAASTHRARTRHHAVRGAV